MYRLCLSFAIAFIVYILASLILRLADVNSGEAELIAGLAGLMFAALERILIFSFGYWGGNMNIFSGAKSAKGGDVEISK